jgi:hypothetical protein
VGEGNSTRPTSEKPVNCQGAVKLETRGKARQSDNSELGEIPYFTNSTTHVEHGSPEAEDAKRSCETCERIAFCSAIQEETDRIVQTAISSYSYARGRYPVAPYRSECVRNRGSCPSRYITSYQGCPFRTRLCDRFLKTCALQDYALRLHNARN